VAAHSGIRELGKDFDVNSLEMNSVPATLRERFGEDSWYEFFGNEFRSRNAVGTVVRKILM
jgi:hypothetical protein